MSLRVRVVDYGAGNLHSVMGALEDASGQEGPALDVRLAHEAGDLEDADAVVLPGVGSFAAAMERLEASGLAAALVTGVRAGRPLLGICLGMQVLLSEGDEGGKRRGLGLIPGCVRPLPPGVKRPHMGWNRVLPLRDDPLLPRGSQPFYAYFAHGYAAEDVPAGAVTAVCRYGNRNMVAAVRAGAAFGTQFHPERSGAEGRAIFARFLREAARAGGREAVGL